MHHRRLLACLLAVAVLGGVPSMDAVAADARPARDVDPVVLTGAQFPGWSAGPELSLREPVLAEINSDCPSDATGNHNCSQASRIANPLEGVAVDRLLGYRWDAASATFVQIPLQVDERFTRYISNLASNCTAAGPFCVGFGAYSAADPQLSYVYDREGYRFTEHAGGDECRATMRPGDAPEPDPVRGLDDNDELVFLYRDTGAQAPATAAVPAGVDELREVRIDDPASPGAEPRYAYVALTAHEGPSPAYTHDNGYVRYVRDPEADLYGATSANYGNAPQGPRCDAEGNITDSGPRRPRDTAWVLTTRYAFRYEGRWVMRGVRVTDADLDAPLADPSEYGPPLVDQWKARAYQQSPGHTTPCCGFQTEQDNWGGSSVLLGERWGPVRVIRTTWGSDSGTNTVRQEIFYPDVILQQNHLRVHTIPPLGGIFSYWDHTAGVVTKYFNPQRPEGVDVDGRNDEVFGTFHVAVRPGGLEVRADDPLPLIGPQRLAAGSQDGCFQLCSDLDVTDPTLGATGTLLWEQVSGEFGSIVFRKRIHQLTPGAVQGVVAMPYYRDDSCFDDGTGTDPGPHLRPRNPDDGTSGTWTDPDTGETKPRECWRPEHGRPAGDLERDRRWFQGAIGSHGVQLVFVAESDNAFTTLPLTEVNAEERLVVLPGDPGNVGDRYAGVVDLPLLTTVANVPSLRSGEASRDPSHVEFRAVRQGNHDVVVVNAALTDAATQDGLAGREVRVYVDGEVQAIVQTAQDGSAHAKFAYVDPEGSTFRVEFAGDQTHAPAAAEATFERNGAKGSSPDGHWAESASIRRLNGLGIP